MELFGRILQGKIDQVSAFRIEAMVFPDDNFEGVQQEYPVALTTNNPNDVVTGTVYTITEKELEQADQYETEAYTRITVELESGIAAWIYVLSTGNTI